MSNIEGQSHRIIGPATLADILGSKPKLPIIEQSPPGEEADEGPAIYTRSVILAESVGKGVIPGFCSLGTGVTVPRHFA
jgi:hypothetical protein